MLQQKTDKISESVVSISNRLSLDTEENIPNGGRPVPKFLCHVCYRRLLCSIQENLSELLIEINNQYQTFYTSHDDIRTSIL